MKCHKALKDYSTGVFEVDYSRTLEILGYQEQLWGWVLKIQAHDLFIYEKSPMLVVPTLEDIRDRKLTRIL